MIKKLCQHFIHWITKHTELTDNEQKTIAYSTEIFLSEASKFLLMSLPFILFGYWYDFLIATLLLGIYRMLTGGYHAEHYWSCLAATLGHIFVIVLLSNTIHLQTITPILLLSVSVICVIIAGPIQSRFRPLYTRKKKLLSKIIVGLIISIYSVLSARLPLTPHLAIPLWIFFTHGLQILFVHLNHHNGHSVPS